MLGIFRTNQLAANLLLIIYVVVLRILGLLTIDSWEPANMGFLSGWVYSYVGTNGWGAEILAILLVLLQAFMLNVLSARFRISKEVSMYPGVFYILLMSTIPAFLHLSPVLMGNTFLIIALINLFEAYKKSSVADSIFSFGFWVGVAFLFYYSNIIFLIMGILGLFTLRSFRINEIFMIFIGFIAPVFFVGTMTFLQDDYNAFYQQSVVDNLAFLDFMIMGEWSIYVAAGLFGILVLWAFVSFSTYYKGQQIKARKYIQVLYYYIAFVGITIFFQKGVGVEQLMLFTIPLSLLLPLNFLSFRNKGLGSAIHMVWLIVVLAIQYQLLFLNGG